MRKQFLWLYGVLVALVIREATTEVIPLITRASVPLSKGNIFFYLSRWAIVMIMVLRCYLGAVYLMASSPESDSSRITEAIGLFSGLIHFSLFYAWASTIDLEARATTLLNLTGFGLWLLVVLLYDLVWFVASWNNSFHKLKLWTFVNVVTALLVIAIHFILGSVTTRWKVTELVACVPVLLASLVDISDTINGTEFYSDFFRTLGGG